MCSIQVRWFIGNEQNQYPHCGATIITPDWILTAPHCFSYPVFYMLFPVVCGIYHVYSGPIEDFRQERLIDRLIPHEHFGIGAYPENYEYNIALGHLNDALQIGYFVKPVTLVAFDSDIDGSFLAIGYGSNQSSPLMQPNRLLVADFELIQISECYDVISVPGFDGLPVFDNTICGITSKVDDGSICRGDAGGPLLRKIGDFEVEQVGIIFGQQLPCGSGPSAFLDIRPFVNWIDETIKRIESEIETI